MSSTVGCGADSSAATSTCRVYFVEQLGNAIMSFPLPPGVCQQCSSVTLPLRGRVQDLDQPLLNPQRNLLQYNMLQVGSHCENKYNEQTGFSYKSILNIVPFLTYTNGT
eukprot:TRINITY_DN118240_c0_g1_i9.p1 TRINITY_DN118240_c0_g1~~TRINITY_DN118240_c0_g1_i9.p1  ORF type:complete len:109 (+),score=10.03 TRINITY_DN118240_c0_g1_i9:357-683(+)